jgi:hypothetical protein
VGAAEIIAHYEALAALTGRMHETALRGDWDALSTSNRSVAD